MRIFIPLALVAGLIGCHSSTVPHAVSTSHQALMLVQEYEQQLLRNMYGPEVDPLPLASTHEPYAIREHQDSYEFVFRKPVLPRGDGYIKTFYVDGKTGKVSRGAWMLGR